MEKSEQKILEILLGLILIILLVVMIVLLTAPKTTGNTTTITDSFNTNNYYNTIQKDFPVSTKTYYPENYLDYDYSAYKKTTKGILGNTIEHYTVYVKNQDYKPGYFRVNYYFTDYYGKIKNETMTYYIKPQESKKFIYKNIYDDKYRFYDWNYKIISRTQI